MKIISLTPAMVLAAIVGSAQPTLTQLNDQSGSGAGWMGHQAWGRGAMHDGGAHFRFAPGNARIDIQCPANEDVEHCVKAAGELIGKVMSAKENAGTAGLNPDGAPNANPPPGQSPSPPPVVSTPGKQ